MKRKFRFSLHFKLILSYIAVIFMIGVISVSFVYIFANTYILMQTKQRLVSNAEALARDAMILKWSPYGTKNEDLQIIFRRNLDASVSLLLADSGFEYISNSGMNIDHLSVAPEEFVSTISRLSSPQGTHFLRSGNTNLVVYVQPIYGESGTPILYAILFSIPISYQLQRSLLTLYLIALAAASFLAISISLLFTTGITKNIRKLKLRADLVANRQFESEIRIDSNDELADLALAIDRMAKSLSEYDAGQKKFLQNASHELRTPLMSIRGYVEGLKDGVFQDSGEVCDQVLEQVSRLEKLIGELIYLSKIENTNEVIERSPVRVSDLIEEAVSRVSGMSGSGGVQISIGETADAKVLADAEKMVTALTNLLSNAFRFAQKEIQISSSVRENWVVISIADDGPGIAPEDIDHIFDRFYKGRQGKFGLGLSIVNAIVVAHEGAASAYNRSGKNGETGAVFEIRLPLCRKRETRVPKLPNP